MKMLRLIAAASMALAATAALATTDTALVVPVRNQIPAVLNLDGQRARQVDSILESAYARLSMVRSQFGAPASDTARLALLTALLTIRYETDTQLATVLTPDEFARMKESMYLPKWERAIPSRGTPM
jgi:hypothetical protein